MSKKYCAECGAEVNESNKFCPGCGTKLKKETPKKEITIPKKDFNLTKKHALIIVIAIIIVIALILIATGGFSDTPAHIKDVKVYKADKIYKIEFTCDIPYDEVMVTLYKDGEPLYNTKGTYGEYSGDGSSIAMELVKDVDIDEILFTVFDSNMKVLDSGHVKDFKIEKKGSMSEIGVYKEDNSKKTANDIYEENEWEITKSHRDKYDYDGDGFLNDYEFEQFCKGEGQEDLLDY